MPNLYKGEYLDVSTLYIGQKIEEGFKLIRDQMSMGDPINVIAELTAVLRETKLEHFNNSTHLCEWLETISVRLSSSNRHLTNLEFLAPPPVDTAKVKETTPVDTAKAEETTPVEEKSGPL